MPDPEQIARQHIDRMLLSAGWIVQDRDQINLSAGEGVAVREFPLSNGFADYLLFADRKACGVIEAKKYGTTLSGVADQNSAYITGLPENIPHVDFPLPFAYESTGLETYFRDERDPDPRSRSLFSFHRPETLAAWAAEDTTLRQRFRNNLQPFHYPGLWANQIEAIRNLEESLKSDRPRALIQMATGSGKTVTAITFLYRLIKFGGIRRALFLVDRNNLGRQAIKEFQNYITPDDGRKFTELYNVQRLTTNAIDTSNQIVITTIQRLYSMLKGDAQFDPANEEGSLFENLSISPSDPMQVVYNPAIPIETFDVIVTDECHRSIYNLWRQVLEYFDAHLIGLTATPSSNTMAFFNSNLVMEYTRERAVADGVNVDGQVYTIRTRITEEGARVDAGTVLPKRDKRTREKQWETLDEDLEYEASQLDREVVSKDQIRTIIRTYKENLPELFPGRQHVPKTLIFAKDDSHAEDIVHIVREEFGKGNQFCKKITYRVSGESPEQLIQDFRNNYNPRIAVSVDMIATGTDIKPLEVLLFMRLVKSRTYFEQMLGRGTRTIQATDLEAVTPDARRKTHFLIIDAVGILEGEKVDPKIVERKPFVKFEKLLEQVALGVRDEDTLLSLASRLASLVRGLDSHDDLYLQEHFSVAVDRVGAGSWQLQEPPTAIQDLPHRFLDAFDPDTIHDTARGMTGEHEPSQSALEAAELALAEDAARLLAASPDLRNQLVRLHHKREQYIDDLSRDEVVVTGFDPEGARKTIDSFRKFIEDHKDEIDALRLLYARPARLQKLTFRQIQELSERIQQPPFTLTTEALWNAYARLEQGKVRGAGTRRVLTDLISLVRHALQFEDELTPFPQIVQARYQDWLKAQEAAGVVFSAEQRWWLDRIAEQIAVNLKIDSSDFEYGDFFQHGGELQANDVFHGRLKPVLLSLNEQLINNGNHSS